MQAGMVVGAAHAPEASARPDDGARTHVDRLHRHVRHAPAAAAHGHEAAARADAAGHHDPPAARGPHGISGRRREVGAAMLAGGERVCGNVEPTRDAAPNRVGEDERESRGGDHPGTVRPDFAATVRCAWIGTHSARFRDGCRVKNVNCRWVREAREPGRAIRPGQRQLRLGEEVEGSAGRLGLEAVDMRQESAPTGGGGAGNTRYACTRSPKVCVGLLSRGMRD